jgi:hypothetical protein
MRTPRNMNIILRILGAKGSRIQVRDMEFKTLESYFRFKGGCLYEIGRTSRTD